MPIQIAIPEPTSSDAEYNSRSLPPYVFALESSGAIPLVLPLHESQERIATALATVQGVLLPGSRFDVDPERYGELRLPQCGPADPDRTAIDELLLQDAFNLRKPVLAICHGLQTLNIWLNGTLVQDLESRVGNQVNHNPRRGVVDAHPIQIEQGSYLGRFAAENGASATEHVNSSHHQAVARLGDRLRISATSIPDKVIEAVELDSSEHFAIGVQWHPERTFTEKPLSRAIFRAFVNAAEAWRLAAESTVVEDKDGALY